MQAVPSTAEGIVAQGNDAMRRKDWSETVKQNENFLFSFIITTGKVKQYLVETVESVLAQSVGLEDNIQIVLVGDGSTAVCEKYRRRHPDNIILIDLPDGVGAARNAGLKAAVGCWINFLDPGDMWGPEACETALDFFGRYPKLNVACFPITLYGVSRGAHWLNYKFTKTRVANIFNDPDCAVLDLCSCFCRREVVKDRSFNGSLPGFPEESTWITELLLDEQDFGLVTKPHCRCRFPRSSATKAMPLPPEQYAEVLRSVPLAILCHAKERHGEVPEWAQYAVMLDLCRRFREPDKDTFTSAQKEEYQGLVRACLGQIDDRIICAVRTPYLEERLLALALKHGMGYEQVKEWIEPDAEEQTLRFCRPGAESSPLKSRQDLWLEFMDISGRQLLLRGSCPLGLAPSERVRLVLTLEFPDGGIREWPCELVRRPDLKRRRLVFEDDFWPREGFELALPLADIAGEANLRAFVEIDGIRFDLKWMHKHKSPFVRSDERLSWERTGFTVSPLPGSAGLHMERQEGDDNFLFSFIIPAYNVKPYLAEAVESVIAQTVGFEENIQIVLVNDGSTDGTAAVCKRYRDLYPDNIVYIEKPNGGVSSARNAGIKAATGRYINFLDADDKWDPGACQAALDFFEEHPEINIVCFPIMLFDRRTDGHWLNYKFKQTKVANIFKDTEYALYHVITCFIRGHAARIIPFDERLSISEDVIWLAILLLNQQNFGVISNPSYRYRKRFDQSSAIDMKSRHLGNYMITPRISYIGLLNYAFKKYNTIPYWAQYAVMLDITWRIKQKDDGFLTVGQKKEYQGLMRDCLTRIDDQIICTVRNLASEERLCALALKYGVTYEQVKEWVRADEETCALRVCLPGAPPLNFADIGSFWLEFMDVAGGELLLRGSFPVMTTRERTVFVLETELPDGNKQEYPCELFRRADRKKRPFFENDLWALESFEMSLPLADGIRVGAFVAIDGIRFELKWQHEKLSPFVRGNEASYLSRAGYIISKLSDDKGVLAESWTSLRAQEREQTFLRSIARQKAETPPALVARIRRAARWMRRLSKRPIWLISDRIAFAGDNGEALFEYLMVTPEARQGARPFFVLSRDSEDWERLKQIGPTVAYGSIPHKILFLAADKVISSSADDFAINPFAKDDWLYRDLFNFDFVFLQHGVTKDNQAPWLNRANKNIALFVTSAARERQSIVEGDYGYATEQVVLTGFPRHDKLLSRTKVEQSQRLVAVMPTWRSNLVIARDPVTMLSLPNPAFTASGYFRFWNGLLNHPHLLEALHDYGYRLHFAIHPQSTHEGSKFQVPDPVEVVFHCDYAQTFCAASLLLTDYSSVAFDFVLLRKPLVYAHFDFDTFYSGHIYEKGFFDYERDGFGPVCPDLETTVDAVIYYLENGCEMEPLYRDRVDDFFGVQPENRCQAVVEAIRKLGVRTE